MTVCQHLPDHHDLSIMLVLCILQTPCQLLHTHTAFK